MKERRAGRIAEQDGVKRESHGAKEKRYKKRDKRRKIGHVKISQKHQLVERGKGKKAREGKREKQRGGGKR